MARAGTPWDLMLELAPRYGPVTVLRLPVAGDFFLVHSPSAVEELTAVKTASFPDRLSTPVFAALGLDRGLVYERGAAQRRNKSLCRPSFANAACLESFLDATVRETVRLGEAWRERGAPEGLRVDLYAEARRLTLEVVLRVTFGVTDPRISERLSDTIAEFIQCTVDVANEVPPLWPLGLSLSYRRVQQLLPEIRSIVGGIIESRREELLGGSASLRRGDLLGEVILQQASGDGDALAFDDDDLLAILFDVVIAGSDTTASTVAAAIFLLHKEPAALVRVRDEVEAAGGSAGLSSLALDDLDAALPFTSAAVKEALRLYPPVPFVGRVSSSADTIAGCAIPDGATCAWSPWFLGRDPSQWRDPLAFDPTRFNGLDPEHELAPAGGPRHAFAFCPFGAGVRGCLGRRLGITEGTVALAFLLHEYDFRFDSDELYFKYNLTLDLEDRCTAVVTPRA